MKRTILLALVLFAVGAQALDETAPCPIDGEEAYLTDVNDYAPGGPQCEYRHTHVEATGKRVTHKFNIPCKGE